MKRTRSHAVGHALTRKAPSGSEGAFKLGAAYRNRTDDLFITSEASHVQGGPDLTADLASRL